MLVYTYVLSTSICVCLPCICVWMGCVYKRVPVCANMCIKECVSAQLYMYIRLVLSEFVCLSVLTVHKFSGHATMHVCTPVEVHMPVLGVSMERTPTCSSLNTSNGKEFGYPPGLLSGHLQGSLFRPGITPACTPPNPLRGHLISGHRGIFPQHRWV